MCEAPHKCVAFLLLPGTAKCFQLQSFLAWLGLVWMGFCFLSVCLFVFASLKCNKLYPRKITKLSNSASIHSSTNGLSFQ